MDERYDEKSGRRVLLVDDEARFVLQLGKLLEARNFEVTTAPDGRQALARMETRRFDAVLLDLRMPGLDAWPPWPGFNSKNRPRP